jgi:hypothetical protein
MAAGNCPGFDYCTSPDCCLHLCRLARRFGLRINKAVEENDFSHRCLEFRKPRLASKIAKEALATLSFQHEVGRYADNWTAYDLLIEIPSMPIDVWTYFQPQFEYLQNTDLPAGRQLALKRQIALVLASLAFTDKYLNHFSSEDIDSVPLRMKSLQTEKRAKITENKNIIDSCRLQDGVVVIPTEQNKIFKKNMSDIREINTLIVALDQDV